MTKFISVPAYFVVSDWGKPQVFGVQVRENRSYAVVLDFMIGSDLQREAILKRFSDRVPDKGTGDNQIIDFEIEIQNINGIYLLRKIVKTKGIGFHSKDSIGRLIEAVGLDVGKYIITLRLKSDEVLDLDHARVRITYLTK